MSYVTTNDDVDIYYKNWGEGQPVVFSHGCPLTAGSWESQMYHLAANGFRGIAHDRRGHGPSSRPWGGNDMDHYADGLAQVIEHLDQQNANLFGFSTGGGEVAHYSDRHGTKPVAKAGLAVPPLMLQTEADPGGLPFPVFDGLRQVMQGGHKNTFDSIKPHARLIVYPGAPHGITDTHNDQLNADLLAFCKEAAA